MDSPRTDPHCAADSTDGAEGSALASLLLAGAGLVLIASITLAVALSESEIRLAAIFALGVQVGAPLGITVTLRFISRKGHLFRPRDHAIGDRNGK